MNYDHEIKEKRNHSIYLAKYIMNVLERREINKKEHDYYPISLERSDVFFSCRQQGEYIQKILNDKGVNIHFFSSNQDEFSRLCNLRIAIDKNYINKLSRENKWWKDINIPKHIY